jgi:hypothetical protein
MQLNKIYSTCFILACAGLFAPRSAFSEIGRVGNDSIGDSIQGFSAQVPNDFNQISTAAQGGVNLGSNYMLDPEFGTTENIQAIPFGEIYPGLVTASSASVLAFFQAAPGMTYTAVTTPNCSLSLLGEGTNTLIGIVTWGNGNGYILTAAKTDEAKQGILTMLQNTQITTPCWK